MTEPIEIARTVAVIATDMLAADTTLLDISEIASFADVFVVSSADNIRQLRALQEQIIQKLKDDGVRPLRTEGVPESGWVVMDYGDVVVHLLTQDQRKFYRLEDLWSEAPVLLKIQ